MAKIKHNNFLNTVNEVINNAKQQKIVHLYAEDKKFSGRHIQVNGKVMCHFGTTGYLGLEQDQRLKDAAIQAIQAYGTQFPLSKTYISHPLYASLEEKMTKIYKAPIIITKNSTLGHMAVIPTAVDDSDGVILDHQVHWSVQSAVQILKNKGVKVEMIRHNNLEMLEAKIKELNDTCTKIWYMADGVYSMFGDYAPLDNLMELSKKYPKLHFYFDDVHGMSWAGEHGAGYVMSKLKEVPSNCLLFGTLSKSFGAGGAVLACPNLELRDKIKNFGGPLTFSAQLDPASVAAAIASADIHLSYEIYELQNDLKIRIQHFNSLLEKTDLPLIDKNESPVFYIGTGLPTTGYNFVNRLFREGFFVNLGLFPAVPVKNTGVRITISRHNELTDINALVEAMILHYPKALEETQTSYTRVRKMFRLPVRKELNQIKNPYNLKLHLEKSINMIGKSHWNLLMAKQSIFDWDGLMFLEKVFSDHYEPENKWDFYYIIISDINNNPILATFLTRSLWKDDMLAPPSVSEQIEFKRKADPYYMSNYVLSTGSLITEGNHWYLDTKNLQWKEAVLLLIKKMEEIDEYYPAEMFVFRDFLEENKEVNDLLHSQGFIKIKMPDSGKITHLEWTSEENYIASLSPRSRRHFRQEVKQYEDKFVVEWKSKITIEEKVHIQRLYTKVKLNNLGLNTFEYPLSLISEMRNHPHWEFLILYLNDKSNKVHPKYPIGMMCCYKNQNHTYVPVVVGMDYAYSEEYNTYRQLLYQTIKRAGETGFKTIDFGLTAPFEKRKLGATIYDTYAYVQAKDNFSLELLTTIQTK